MKPESQKITTFLTFNDKAEHAMKFYTSIFKESKVLSEMRFGGTFFTGSFELFGQEFVVLNGGPHFTFAQGFSLYVKCYTQEEIDYYWEKLSEGGEKQPCGWLKDQFGVSWQIVPPLLAELLQDKNQKKAQNVMEAMMQMGKIEIQTLKDAYDRG